MTVLSSSGKADVKNVVFTDTQDDSMDIDAGWQGRAQFLFIKHGTVTVDGNTNYMGNGGFEADGEKNNGPDYSQHQRQHRPLLT